MTVEDVYTLYIRLHIRLYIIQSALLYYMNWKVQEVVRLIFMFYS